MNREALISPCGKYRYWLTRTWASGSRVLFVMLNPSTADALADDPTIRRCCGFAERWGYSGIGVVNLFAYRATKPADLIAAARTRGIAEVIGPECDQRIAWLIDDTATYPLVVAAWGAQATSATIFDARVRQVSAQLRERKAVCLGRTTAGTPRHPLMLPYNVAREPF